MLNIERIGGMRVWLLVVGLMLLVGQVVGAGQTYYYPGDSIALGQMTYLVESACRRPYLISPDGSALTPDIQFFLVWVKIRNQSTRPASVPKFFLWDQNNGAHPEASLPAHFEDPNKTIHPTRLIRLRNPEKPVMPTKSSLMGFIAFDLPVIGSEYRLFFTDSNGGEDLTAFVLLIDHNRADNSSWQPRPIVPAGKPFFCGAFEYRVSYAEWKTTIGSLRPRGTFLAVGISVRNITTDAALIPGFWVIDNHEGEYKEIKPVAAFPRSMARLRKTPLNPDSVEYAYAMFDIPHNAHSYWLRIPSRVSGMHVYVPIYQKGQFVTPSSFAPAGLVSR